MWNCETESIELFVDSLEYFLLMTILMKIVIGIKRPHVCLKRARYNFEANYHKRKKKATSVPMIIWPFSAMFLLMLLTIIRTMSFLSSITIFTFIHSGTKILINKIMILLVLSKKRITSPCYSTKNCHRNKSIFLQRIRQNFVEQATVKEKKKKKNMWASNCATYLPARKWEILIRNVCN